MIIEGSKALLRMVEYHKLVYKENINAYIDIDAYKELKVLKEIKDNHFFLVRSKKQVPKIKSFPFSKKLLERRKN